MTDQVSETVVERVTVVGLGPRDLLLVRVPAGTRPEVCSAVSRSFERVFPDHRVLVDNIGVEVEAVAADG